MTRDTGEHAGPRHHKSLLQLSGRPLGSTQVGITRGPSRAGIKRQPHDKAAQREKALARANEIRLDRAAWKRRAGASNARAAIHEPPRYLLTASVKEILTAVHRVGDTKARKVCGRANVNALRELGELTAGERGRLLRVMDDVPLLRGPAAA